MWRITLASDTYDTKALPSFITNTPTHYLTPSQKMVLNEASLRLKTPHGIVNDDTDYAAAATDSILRPGNMLGSFKSDKVVNGQLMHDTFADTTASMPSQRSIQRGLCQCS